MLPVPSAESRVTAAIDAFQDAGVGQGSWETALRRFAEATGSRSGQLIGIGRDWATPFNWVTSIPKRWRSSRRSAATIRA